MNGILYLRVWWGLSHFRRVELQALARVGAIQESKDEEVPPVRKTDEKKVGEENHDRTPGGSSNGTERENRTGFRNAGGNGS